MSATLASRRTPLSILAFVAVFLILAGIFGFYFMQRRVERLQRESGYYAGQIGLHMAEHWSPELLMREATPELRARLATEGKSLEVLSRELREFGPPWMYLGAKGKLNHLFLAAFGGDVSASYAAKASYRPGVVTFRLGIVKQDGHWRIDKFHIDFLNIEEVGGGG